MILKIHIKSLKSARVCVFELFSVYMEKCSVTCETQFVSFEMYVKENSLYINLDIVTFFFVSFFDNACYRKIKYYSKEFKFNCYLYL